MGYYSKSRHVHSSLLAACSCWLVADGCVLLPRATGCCY